MSRKIYLHDPLRILKIWEGGLASHGAAVGIVTALWLYSRRYPRYSYTWLLDRATISATIGGAFIRLGNLFNSEILGKPSDLPWAFVFVRVDSVARHPVQLYEAIAYFALFGAVHRMYWRGWAIKRPLSIAGTYFAGVFGVRFLLEFFKANQESFEASLPLGLNMGQWLSVPVMFAGLALLAWSCRRRAPASASAPAA